MSNQSDLITRYIEIRDRKKAIQDKAKKDTAVLNDALAKIEGHFLKHFQTEGTDSIKSPNGTVYRSTRVSVPVADWDEVLTYIKENDMWHFLDHRVNKSAIQQFRDENDDLPPGVGWREEAIVNVRRK